MTETPYLDGRDHGLNEGRKQALADAVEQIERVAFRYDGETKQAILDVADQVRRL
jgi:hypothetical protein